MRMELLHSSRIDPKKWDDHINKHQASVFAEYDHLSILCDEWEAVIIDDHQTVLPLPFRKKWGIKYYYIPPFIQQLGLIGDHTLLDQAISFATSNARYGDISIAHSNTPYLQYDQNTRSRTNMLVHLNGYRTPDHYKGNFKHKMKRAGKYADNYQDISCEYVIDLFRSTYAHRIHNIKPEEYKRFSQLCACYAIQERLIAKAIVHDSEVLAAVIVLKNAHRYYNVMNVVTDKGRREQANYLLYHLLLNELERGKIFDMKGSEIPEVAHFYKKFKPVIEHYAVYHFNDLPWPIRYLKR